MPRILLTALLLVGLLGLIPAAAQDTPAPAANDGLRVADVLPADGSEGVSPNTLIVVVFNRPVVPLVVRGEADALPDPLQFDPPLSGQGEWVNTSIYTFQPEPGMAGGQVYTVTIDPALTAVDGAALTAPYAWTFTTAAPSVTEILPADGSRGVALDAPIQVRFSTPVDQALAESAFVVRNQAGSNIPGTFEWTEAGDGFRFRTAEPLAIAQGHTVGFLPNVVTAPGGGAPLTGITQSAFMTVPLPGIVSTSPFDGQTDAYPAGGFTIFFQSPMNPDTLRDRVTIDPEPAFAYDTYYDAYNNSYTLSFSTEPSTEYTITIEPGMEDVYGNAIETSQVVRFSTRPFDPDVMLQTPGQVGFYNADNPETRLFLTHRNVSYVDLALYSVPTETFLRLATGEQNYDLITAFDASAGQLLRSWSISSAAPLNQRRYELLNLGISIQENQTCDGAPESRIRIGDSVRVTADAVRVRANPPDGEILTVLYTNAVIPVIGGSTCANGFVWWQVQLPDGRAGWAAEGDLSEYYLQVETPAAQTAVTVTDSDGAALEPGVYFLQVTAPETDNLGYPPLGHFLIVGNTNVTMKTSPDTLLNWVTDVNSGQPIADAPLTVYGANLEPIAAGATDGDGLYSTALPRLDDLYIQRAVLIDEGDRFGIGLSSWSDGIDPYHFGYNVNFYPVPYRVYLYTDRPIYRPDQPVHFRGIVRSVDDVTYTPPAFRSVPVRITDEMGNVVYEQTLTLTPFGSFSATFQLAADAGLGYYQIGALMPGEDASFYGQSGAVGFSVAEYRAPEFQVTLTPEQADIAQGETIRVAIDARYFFGGAVANGDVEYAVIAEPFDLFLPDRAGFSFADYDFDAGASEFYAFNGGEIASGVAQLDANGQTVIDIPAALQDQTRSQRWRIEATITDESDQAVAARTSVIVHKGAVYVGVQPVDYVATVGSPAAVSVITVDWQGEPVPNQTVDIEVVERRWSSVQEADEFGRTVWTSDVEEVPVTAGDLVTDANGEATYTFTPPAGGVYKIRAVTRDGDGNAIMSATQLYVSSGDYVAWRQQNSNRIDLIADATEYAVGDTAEVLITSPFQGSVEALITVERGDVLDIQQITLDGNSVVFEVPILEDFAPTVYVTALLIKGVDENNPVAAFRYGTVQLAVQPDRKLITLDVQPNTDSAGPGDTVTFTVTATDFDGQPVTAEIGAGLTDLSVLTLADQQFVLTLLEYFYGQQGLGVRTSTPLTINTDQLTQTVLDTIKGGGGGFGEGGIFDIREDFIDTAYWNASLRTGEDGMATFDVTLPDNLTTWRLDVRAVTSGEDGAMLVGQTTVDLLSTKPLLIRPVTPRFFVVGDQAVLAAVVNNNTDVEQDVIVNLSGTGVALPDDAEQAVVVPAGGSRRIEWAVTVEAAEDVRLLFTVRNADGSLTDASVPPLGLGDNRLLPVYRYEVPETVGTSGALLDAGSLNETIALPTTLPVVQGELAVTVEASLTATTFNSLQALRTRQNDSTEQTVTLIFANAQVYRALNGLPQMTDAMRQNISQQVGIGIQRLYAQQKVDGGWGWFSRDESDPAMTAYALLGLVEARDQGFMVEDDVIRDAINFLNGRFIVPAAATPQWQLNRQAFILYALARSNAVDVARTVNLFENRARLATWAKALVAVTVASIDGDNRRANVLLSDLVNAATFSATGATWDDSPPDRVNWNTQTRTTAMALHALIRLNPESDLIPNVIRWLVAARTGDTWETTQETAWAILALTDWSLISGDTTPAYLYSVALNGDELAAGQPDDPTRPVLDTAIPVEALEPSNTLNITREPGNGALYYTAFLRAFLPVDQVEPVNDGLYIERRYTLLGDETERPITEARVGDEIQVRLTLIAPGDLNFVVVTDPIPAGTDAVNPELATAPQIGTRPELNRADPLAGGWGYWWFSDIAFRDEQVNLYSAFLPAGTYEFVYVLRAGLPGTYSVIPATAQEVYFPDVYGRSAGGVFTILPAQ
ncbi:MAG: Ig-like domain-containing protein [bacterium]|nr:Ig-like domain-containing protein [bacterium]